MKVAYFKSCTGFREWLSANHSSVGELWVGFYKKASGRGGLTYAEAVDEALCFGWIDGIVRKVDDDRYTHRFTPRRPSSTWSVVNVRHVARLTTAGKMHPAGVRAFAARLAHKTGIYTYELKAPAPRPQKFPAALAVLFRANKKAWNFWQLQPPGYQREAIHWVTSAKKADTRQRRLAALIAQSAGRKRLSGK